MKKYTTSSGSEIVIDDKGIATVSNKKLANGESHILGHAKGVRYSWTLEPWTSTVTIDGIKTRVLGVYKGESCKAQVKLDSETLAWLDENWPVQKSPADKWDELMPEDAKAWRKYQDRMAIWREEVNRRFDNEALSSFLPQKPADKEPALSAEGKAWLKLDNDRYSNSWYIADASQKAIARVLEGSATLVDAEAEAKAKISEESDKWAASN